MKAVLLGIVVIVMVLLSATSHAQQWTGNVNGLLGGKQLDRDDWGSAAAQTEIGILVDFGKTQWPVSIAIDLLRSDIPFAELFSFSDGETTELNLGVRKIWDQRARTRPYIGGGLAIISADISARVLGVFVSENDAGEGLWIDGGVYWTLGEALNVGLDFRYSQADITFSGFDADAGGRHTALLLGYPLVDRVAPRYRRIERLLPTISGEKEPQHRRAAEG